MKSKGVLPEISPSLLALFSRYAAWYLGKNIHSIRLLAAQPPPNDPLGPLVVFLNHAAWWDPLVCLFLRREFFARRRAYAPIEAAALQRYRFLERIGFFPVETGTRRGAARFLKISAAILKEDESALFLTPQGKFSDVRERLFFAPGLERLAARSPDALFVPLAIEYCFWEERKAEVLLAFGEPLGADHGAPLASRLTLLQSTLAAAAIRREPAEWRVLLRSKSGVSRPYDLWRALRARLRGRAFRADHGRL